MKGIDPGKVLASLPAAPEPYAAELFLGVGRRSAELDALVSAQSSSWAIGRMPAVDRQLLRLAAFELAEHPEIPVAVVIDEAVELAKQYSTEDSSRFVNGVLAGLAAKLRPGEARPR